MIQSILDEIGTWTHPATKLKELGIKGDRDDCSTCPMANYIASVMPRDVKWVRVNGITTDIAYVDPNRAPEVFQNPRNMMRFVEWFDEGEYPELDNNPDGWDDDYECPCCTGDDPWL